MLQVFFFFPSRGGYCCLESSLVLCGLRETSQAQTLLCFQSDYGLIIIYNYMYFQSDYGFAYYGLVRFEKKRTSLKHDHFCQDRYDLI